MTKEEFAKVYAFNKIIDHLQKDALLDKRSREKKRAKIALSKIDGWQEEGRNEFERRNN